MNIPQWLQTFWQWLGQSGDGTFQMFFAENLRDSLFSGFLTLGGFLFAAYTFIVIHMKSAVYDSTEYQQTFREKFAADSSLKLYDPLQRMSSKLFYAVAVTLGAAMMQLTVGLWKTNATALLSTIVAVYAFFEVCLALRIMGANIKSWFKSLERHGTPSSE